ncbi:Cof-type HAD-IIB family hydrolase [Polaribacter tangerinus]|uniref:Cof-type HAD-IIB family hydrolase n=1 Tax=Polaribacter tangerinus TaxID=1920034 RepID=UPI000B4ADABF|nr:Cof-type HAD-IIB family hydrolase [Polaribacter tangerinus]
MSFEKIKLVVSDMDGTLLNSNNEVSQRFFKLFKQLQNKNIIFCAVSGRQYNSILDKLYPIKNDIYVIAENGAIAKNKNKLLLCNAIPIEKAMAIIPMLINIDNINIVLCTEETAYITSKDEKFIATFQKYYHSYKIVDNLIDIVSKTPILKIAIHHYNSTEKFVYPAIKYLEKEFLIKISGKNWLDISTEKANKGNALKLIQQKLKIHKNETLVFGDYLNDLEMFEAASLSFAMQNAHKELKKVANFTTKSNDDFGVEIILEKLLSEKK